MEIFTFESLDREDILIYSLIVRRLIVLLETNDEVEFSWDDIHGIFQTTINPNYIESAIDRLYDLNVIEGFTSGDGGGYIPRTFIRNVNYSKAMAIIDTHLKMLNDDFLKQKSELDDCQKKYNDIISFDPASIKDTINDAESKIGEIYELAEKNELIKSGLIFTFFKLYFPQKLTTNNIIYQIFVLKQCI